MNSTTLIRSGPRFRCSNIACVTFSHFAAIRERAAPSDETRRENVDKDAVNTEHNNEPYFVTVRLRIYAPQTKVLEGLTKDEIQVFDILFNGL